MSKILVLGRTMDMGGTEVAMAALLQKLVEKKEDVTLLLVEKRGVLLERIPKEVEVRQMIWNKKPHPALERIVGKRETPAERSFYARGMGVFLMRVVYGKKRYGKLYERILECVEPETKQYDLVFDFFGFGAFTTAFGARKTNARKKRSGSTEKISGGCSGPGTLFRSMIKFTAFPSLSGNRSLPVFQNSRTGQRFC